MNYFHSDLNRFSRSITLWLMVALAVGALPLNVTPVWADDDSPVTEDGDDLLPLEIPLTICKSETDKSPLSDWEMTVSNGVTSSQLITADDGCVTVNLDPDQGPWTVEEMPQAGWQQDEVQADGPGSSKENVDGEDTPYKCVFTGPDPSVAGGDTIYHGSNWSCHFFNSQLPPLDPPVVETDPSPSEEEPEPAQCLTTDTLGDESALNILDSTEKDISTMMTERGYVIDKIADETKVQVWEVADPGAAAIHFDLRVLGKRAGNTQILGYYKAGDGTTYTALLSQVSDTDGVDPIFVPVTIPAIHASSFGFAIRSGDYTWYTEKALNIDGKDHVAVYEPTSSTYLLAFEDFVDLGDSDYNDLLIEVSNIRCSNNDQDSDPQNPANNTCALGQNLGDATPFVINNSTETTISEMLSGHGYGAVDAVNDQQNLQLWNVVIPQTTSVDLNLRVLGKRASNTQIVGYYKAGDSTTFAAILTQGSDTLGEAAIPVNLPVAFASSFGFAIVSEGNVWHTETALNSDALKHVAVYNPVSDTYLLAFEDTANSGDGDYNDLLVEISGLNCRLSQENGGTTSDSTKKKKRSGGSRTRLASADEPPAPQVLGESTSSDSSSEPGIEDPIEPIVLGEQVSVVPIGAPATGDGGTSQSIAHFYLSLPRYLSAQCRKKVRAGK